MADAAQQRWQRVLDHYQAERRLPTVVGGVLQDGRVAWRGCAGAAVAPDAQFRIGSITKTITAVLVMQCVRDGLVGLSDPLDRHLPGTGYPQATIAALLSHTTGMQAEPVGPWWERSPGADLPALLAANDGSGAVAGPKEFWHYSNLGFAYLGALVARVREEDWWSLVRGRVLDPLGMRATSSEPGSTAVQGWSVHHLRGELVAEPAYDTGAMAPAGQLWSTLGDVARLAAFLRDGTSEVLPQALLEEMRTVRDPAISYGLGINVFLRAAHTFVGHNGSMPGFQATMQIDPDSGDGVVALTNATTGFLGLELTERLLGSDDVEAATPWVPTLQVPGWAEELLGWWFWGNSAFEVRWHNEELQWRELARGILAESFHLAGDRIVGRRGYSRGETLTVHRDADGRPASLECCTFTYTRTPYGA